MPRKAKLQTPEKNITPRRFGNLNIEQERFAYLVANGMDRLQAYREAGYRIADDTVAMKAASRLANHVGVQDAIHRLHLERMERTNLSGDQILKSFYLTYLAAMKAGDFSTAVSVLDKLAKHSGLYAEHNKQRNYTQSDVERLKTELEQAGMNFERLALRSEN